MIKLFDKIISKNYINGVGQSTITKIWLTFCFNLWNTLYRKGEHTLESVKQKRNRDDDNPKSINLKVRIDKDTYIKLLKFSQNKGITASEATRQAINLILEK